MRRVRERVKTLRVDHKIYDWVIAKDNIGRHNTIRTVETSGMELIGGMDFETGCRARDVVLALPEVMHLVFRHLGARQLLWRVPAVCRLRNALAVTFQASLELDMALPGDRRMVVWLAATRLPSTQNLTVTGMRTEAVDHLAMFRQLQALWVQVHLFESRHYAALMKLGVTSLEMLGVRVEGLEAMAKHDNSRLQHLAVQMAFEYRPHSFKRPGVEKMAASAPNLRTLRLRRVCLMEENIANLLKLCPKLQTLELWSFHSSNTATCLLTIGEHGAALQDVVFTRKRMYNFAESEFRAETDREAYMQCAFRLFEQRPGLRRLRIRHAEPDFHLTASAAHTAWNPVQPKPALKLGSHNVELVRI